MVEDAAAIGGGAPFDEPETTANEMGTGAHEHAV